MSIPTFFEKPVSFDIAGKFGFGNGYGASRYSIARRADSNEFSGTYQKAITLQGKLVVRKSLYRPTNPQTVKQQAWRAKLAAGWPVYNALTTAQKKALMIEARRYRLTGPTLFMSRYLQAQRS